jgi:hypothetical protein
MMNAKIIRIFDFMTMNDDIIRVRFLKFGVFIYYKRKLRARARVCVRCRRQQFLLFYLNERKSATQPSLFVSITEPEFCKQILADALTHVIACTPRYITSRSELVG